jgi:hypothetical protein
VRFFSLSGERVRFFSLSGERDSGCMEYELWRLVVVISVVPMAKVPSQFTWTDRVIRSPRHTALLSKANAIDAGLRKLLTNGLGQAKRQVDRLGGFHRADHRGDRSVVSVSQSGHNVASFAQCVEKLLDSLRRAGDYLDREARMRERLR